MNAYSPTHASRLSPHASRKRQRGFSFVELMFAVVVLGIGFIMIAAVFPVGMQQTKASLDESTAASGSRGVVARLQQIAQATVQYKASPDYFTGAFPDTYPHPSATVMGSIPFGTTYPGIVRTLNDPRPFAEFMGEDDDKINPPGADWRRYYMWQIVKNELISPSDNRNATAVMIKRDSVVTLRVADGAHVYAPASSLQVISINAQATAQSLFTNSDVSTGGPIPPILRSQREIYNLEPRPVAIQVIFDPNTQTYVATLFSVKGLNGPGTYMRGNYPTGPHPVSGQLWDDVLDAAPNAAAEGAFVVISDDCITGASRGRLNGRIYRLGNRRTDLVVAGTVSFDLAPGYGFTPDAGADGLSGGTSIDDIYGIGVDKNTATGQSGLSYTNPTSASDSLVAGSGAGQGAVALILGRSFADPVNATPTTADGYSGPAMDVAAYTSFVSAP